MFAWARDREAARQQCGRVLLLENCRDASGNPRVALMLPGQRIPRVFATVSAALAAQRQAEGRR